ncbi:hypothetical protein GCM10028809_21220 [Spirosoma gilvum]
MGGIATAAPFAYLAGSSDVFINIYHTSPQEYGWIFAFLSIAVIAPTQLNRFFLKRFTSEQIIFVTLLYQSVVGLVMIFGTWAGWYGQYGLITILFLFLCGQNITGPNAQALSLAPFERHAGSAAALMGSFRMGIGACVSGAVSFFHNNTAIPMVSVMTACVVSSLFILLLGSQVIKHRRKRTDVDEPMAEVML